MRLLSYIKINLRSRIERLEIPVVATAARRFPGGEQRARPAWRPLRTSSMGWSMKTPHYVHGPAPYRPVARQGQN